MGTHLPGDILSDGWPELNDLLLEIVRDCIDRKVVRASNEHSSSKHIPSELKDRLLELLRTRHTLDAKNTRQFSCACAMNPQWIHPDTGKVDDEISGILNVYWWDISEIDANGHSTDSEETLLEAERYFRWDFWENNGELHLAGSY